MLEAYNEEGWDINADSKDLDLENRLEKSVSRYFSSLYCLSEDESVDLKYKIWCTEISDILDDYFSSDTMWHQLMYKMPEFFPERYYSPQVEAYIKSLMHDETRDYAPLHICFRSSVDLDRNFIGTYIDILKKHDYVLIGGYLPGYGGRQEDMVKDAFAPEYDAFPCDDWAYMFNVKDPRKLIYLTYGSTEKALPRYCYGTKVHLVALS